ncbi:MAG TPA: aminoacyl-tRNA hydrolase [Candidatus Cloacimonetes bacterium]|nr:aminoacyl-tRNA hydrolase [Candidatus Cloacimonadota bacterium]
MRLILALGNHPEKYWLTRHNLGFICLDRWALKHKKAFKSAPEYDYLVHKRAVAIKPKTYMNLSGHALRAAMRKWQFEEIMVVHDDVELPSCELRVRLGGGDGGHNGIKSLFEVLPPSELRRLRIGIGKSDVIPTDIYVLEKFDKKELDSFDDCLSLASSFIDTFVHRGFKEVLNDYSKWKKSYSGGETAGIKSPKEE